VDVAGTWRRPRFTGSFTIADGALALPNLGVRLTRVVADVALSGDSVAVRRLEAQTTGQRNGRATLAGAVTFNELSNPTLDLTLDARNFHVIDRPSVADLELSTERGNPLHLTGSVSGSRLSGGIAVAYGNIRIPELAQQKKVVSLDDPEFYRVVDTSLYTNRTLLPSAPPDFVRNLSVQNVLIDMGSDTWLRSSEANINLGGAVRITTSRNERDRDKVQFALDGTLNAQRGTYRLNLGVVQRTFAIEGGTLRFYGADPDINPELAITAIHTVRQYDQLDAKRDVRIQVKIGGTLAQPTLELSSDDTRLQQSDLLSYLITGQPSFEVGSTGQNLNTIASIALPSVGTYIEGLFAGRGLFDYVQLQAVGVGSNGVRTKQVGSVLGSTRLGVGWQIRDRTFVSVNVGLCQFAFQEGLSQFSPGDIAQSAGGKVEYQISPRLGLSAALSLEPQSSRLICQPTPRRVLPSTLPSCWVRTPFEPTPTAWSCT
jgi:autotransporter translocation and assembly factor TamB